MCISYAEAYILMVKKIKKVDQVCYTPTLRRDTIFQDSGQS